jgi:outer membrane protein
LRKFSLLILSGVALGAAMAQNTAPPAGGKLVLSLQKAVEIAVSPDGNTKIRLAGEAVEQARSRSDQARAALLPNVEGSFNDRNATTNLAANGLTSLHLGIPGLSSFTFPSFVGPFTTVDARVSATQSVFDFSSIRRMQAARAGIGAARSDAENTGELVAAQVARAYLSAIRAEADVEAAQANITLSKAVLTQAENQKAAGTGTGIEITRARVQLTNDQQRLLVAQNARRSAHLQLMRAIGLKLDTELELSDKLAYVPVDATTVEAASAAAMKERPDLKAQQDREANARLSANAVKLERLPTLGAFGDYGVLGSGLNNSLPTRTVGISLKVPIWDGGRKDARRVEAASQYRAEKTRTTDLKQQIELDVRLALDGLRSAQDQVNVAKEGLELAQSELTQAQRRYEAGITNSLEVTDAQTRLERARDNQTAALYNYNLARIDLAQAMGSTRRTIQ